MISKWQQTHKHQQLNLKNNNRNKLSKQLEQEQNHRNGDHMQGYKQGGEWGEWGKGTRNKKHNW